MAASKKEIDEEILRAKEGFRRHMKKFRREVDEAIVDHVVKDLSKQTGIDENIFRAMVGLPPQKKMKKTFGRPSIE